MACKCDRIADHVREDVAESYDVSATWSLARVRDEGRERLYRCSACGGEFLQTRAIGDRPNEQDVVYFRLPPGAAAGFDALDARPLLRGYYRARLARLGPVEEEGECGASGCVDAAVKGSAFCPLHLHAARAGRLGEV